MSAQRWPAGVLILVAAASAALASPRNLEIWRRRYPTSTLPERIEREAGEPCQLCHSTFGYAWDDPGNAYREQLHYLEHAGFTFEGALEAAAGLDADADGVPNAVEILFPRGDGEVGYHPGLAGAGGRDPTGFTGEEVVTGTAETPPLARDLEIEPAILDFGERVPGEDLVASVLVRNTAPVARAVRGVELHLGSLGGFSLEALPPLPVVVAPGEALPLPVRFDVRFPGYFYRSLGWLEIRHDGPSGYPVTALLRGRGGSGRIEVSPPALDFGALAVGTTSALDVRLRNVGTLVLRVIDARLEGPAAGEFALAEPLRGLRLGLSDSAWAHVECRPTREGTAECDLLVLSDDAERPELRVPVVAQAWGEARERVIPGDANRDGRIDISDAVTILLSLFARADPTCPEVQDADDNGRVELTDAIFLLARLFRRRPGPPACGLDPSSPYLGCPSGYGHCAARGRAGE